MLFARLPPTSVSFSSIILHLFKGHVNRTPARNDHAGSVPDRLLVEKLLMRSRKKLRNNMAVVRSQVFTTCFCVQAALSIGLL
jgi:hypothetical protein